MFIFSVDKYNPGTDSWEHLPDMKTERRSPGTIFPENAQNPIYTVL